MASTLKPEDVPLELLPKHIRGDIETELFDDEQRGIMKCTGALDMILIENASEIFRQIMMGPGVIEDIMNKLFGDKCQVLESATFDFWSADPRDIPREESNAQMRTYKATMPRSNRKRYQAIIVGASMGYYGGHYASFLYDTRTKDVSVFDSMNPHSAYATFFADAANILFNPKRVLFPEDMTMAQSVQLTGGFPENPPLAAFDASRSGEWGLLPVSWKRAIAALSTESQNHFCYMWSIWSLHHRVTKRSIMDSIVRMELGGTDPLVGIKKYIWAMLHITGTFDLIPKGLRPMFNKWWNKVYYNNITAEYESPLPYRTPFCGIRYGTAEIELSKIDASTDAIDYSLNDINLYWVSASGSSAKRTRYVDAYSNKSSLWYDRILVPVTEEFKAALKGTLNDVNTFDTPASLVKYAWCLTKCWS